MLNEFVFLIFKKIINTSGSFIIIKSILKLAEAIITETIPSDGIKAVFEHQIIFNLNLEIIELLLKLIVSIVFREFLSYIELSYPFLLRDAK